MGNDIFGFCRKADHQLRTLFVHGEARKDVGVFGQCERRNGIAVLLDFLVRRLRGAPVRDGGNHDCRVDGQGLLDLSLHLQRGFDINAQYARRRWQMHGASDQYNLSPQISRRSSNRKTLTPR